MKQIKKSLLYVIPALINSFVLCSCLSLLPPGAVQGGFIIPPRQPLTFSSCSISLTDRTGLPADNRYASEYLETLLAQAGYSPGAKGTYILGVTCREQSIENDLQGKLSITAVLTVTDFQDRIISRFIYLGHSKEGFESDLLLYRIINQLIRMLAKTTNRVVQTDA